MQTATFLTVELQADSWCNADFCSLSVKIENVTQKLLPALHCYHFCFFSSVIAVVIYHTPHTDSANTPAASRLIFYLTCNYQSSRLRSTHCTHSVSSLALLYKHPSVLSFPDHLICHYVFFSFQRNSITLFPSIYSSSQPYHSAPSC